MESNLSFLANRAISAPTADASPAANPAHTHSEKSDFADVFNGQTLKAQRQQLAALNAPGQGLQVVPLGSKLNIITSDAPLPDMDSLAQFARMQGLDEGAVQALFGTASAAKTAALAATGLATDALAQQTSSATLLVAATQTADLAGAALASGALGQQTLSTTQDLNATLAAARAAGLVDATLTIGAQTANALGREQIAASALGLNATLAAAQAAGLKTSSLTEDDEALNQAQNSAQATQAGLDALAWQASTSLVTAPPTMALSPLTAVVPAGIAPATPGAQAVANALASAAAAQSSPMPLTAQAWIGSAPVAPVDASAAMPLLAPQDAVRLTLGMPAPEITKRLAQMSGTGKETTWAALLASGPVAKALPGATETVTLEVPVGLDLDVLATATEADTLKPSDLSTQAGAAGALSGSSAAAGAAGGNSADTAQAQADQRAQQFQQLADKMGQAAAQRLIAQIERGQWKMQMRMQPAALGSVNVELDMHAGGLDALFSTDNAVTRELMAQGSNKLRDTLTQAGMTVASVTVNGEQSRQSGGNSTPGKGRGPTPGARPASGLASAAVTAPQGAPAAAVDGLNVLA